MGAGAAPAVVGERARGPRTRCFHAAASRRSASWSISSMRRGRVRTTPAVRSSRSDLATASRVAPTASARSCWANCASTGYASPVPVRAWPSVRTAPLEVREFQQPPGHPLQHGQGGQRAPFLVGGAQPRDQLSHEHGRHLRIAPGERAEPGARHHQGADRTERRDGGAAPDAAQRGHLAHDLSTPAQRQDQPRRRPVGRRGHHGPPLEQYQHMAAVVLLVQQVLVRPERPLDTDPEKILPRFVAESVEERAVLHHQSHVSVASGRSRRSGRGARRRVRRMGLTLYSRPGRAVLYRRTPP